jgi:transposase
VLQQRHIIARMARKGIDSSERLGRYRWVVGRTLSWLNRDRRLKVRYERREDIHYVWIQICQILSTIAPR